MTAADVVAHLRYRDLLFSLVLTELKVKYRGSTLGFLWSLLNPLALILIYSVAFRYIIRIQIERFTVFLIAGLLPWGFFASSATASTISLMVNAGLLKKVHFPREILPAATVLFNLIQTLLALAVFLPSLFVLRGSVPWTLVFYPVVLAIQAVFVLGVALGLSALTVSFRDLRHLTEVGLTMLFWLTPIVYRISMVPAGMQAAFRLNPMTSFVSVYQDIAYWGRPPSAGDFLVLAGWAVGALLVGWAIFRRRAPYLAEDL
ncbi:MAG: ABC transporter permease [bacterium]|nr:ABC transporter permease [bacterium]